MIEIKDTEVLFETPVLTLYKVNYINKHGKKRFWFKVSRPEGQKAVMIVGIKDGGPVEEPKLVVTKEFRVPIGDYEWGFPAGLMDPGEDMIESAIRELKEETGLTLVNVFRMSPFVFNGAGMTDESVAIVYAHVLGEPSDAGNEDSEEIETYLMSPSGVGALLQRKDLKFGAKAWIIMDRFARTGTV